MIKNLIFDLGGVIVFHPELSMSKAISEIFSINLEDAKNLWEENGDNLRIGKTTSKLFLSELKEKFNSAKSLKQLLEEWNDYYRKNSEEINYKLLLYIKKLKKQFNIYLLTDTIDTHADYNASRGLYKDFKRVFRSHLEGFKKPYEETFLNALNKTNSKPEETVFIDDLEKNVEGAKKLGINGILYNNFNQLKADLEKLGVK